MGASIWLAVGAYVVMGSDGLSVSQDSMAFPSQAACQVFVDKTAKPYVEAEGAILAYGLKCIEVELTVRPVKPTKPEAPTGFLPNSSAIKHEA